MPAKKPRWAGRWPIQKRRRLRKLYRDWRGVWDPKLKQFHLRKGPDDLLTPSRRPPKLEFEVQPRIVRTDEDIPVYTDEEKKAALRWKKDWFPWVKAFRARMERNRCRKEALKWTEENLELVNSLCWKCYLL